MPETSKAGAVVNETESNSVVDIGNIIPTLIGKKRGIKKTDFTEYTNDQDVKIKNLDEQISELREEQKKFKEQEKRVDKKTAASLK